MLVKYIKLYPINFFFFSFFSRNIFNDQPENKYGWNNAWNMIVEIYILKKNKINDDISCKKKKCI